LHYLQLPLNTNEEEEEGAAAAAAEEETRSSNISGDIEMQTGES